MCKHNNYVEWPTRLNQNIFLFFKLQVRVHLFFFFAKNKVRAHNYFLLKTKLGFIILKYKLSNNQNLVSQNERHTKQNFRQKLTINKKKRHKTNNITYSKSSLINVNLHEGVVWYICRPRYMCLYIHPSINACTNQTQTITW